MATPITFKIFGTPEIVLDAEHVQSRLLNKAQAIVFYLAMSEQPATRSSLALLLWGDMPESSARANLRKALGNLRAELGIVLEIDRRYAAFRPEVTRTVDALDFAARTAHDLCDLSAEELQAALAIYRGEFLQGFYVRNAPDFDRWMWAETERFRQLAIRSLHQLIDLSAAEQHHERAIDCARRLLTYESWNEEAHYKLMVALAANGARAAAVAQYQVCTAVLAEELGVKPSAQISELYETLRDGADAVLAGTTSDQQANVAKPGSESYATAEPVVIRRVPPLPMPLTGRDTDLNGILGTLADPACRLLTIVGPGGMGKTSLAAAVGHRVRGFDDGVFFLPLADVSSVEEVLPRLHRVLPPWSGERVSSGLELIDDLRSRNPVMLVILDNYEQLLPDGRGLINELLTSVSRLKIIVTSRSILNLRWEWRHELQELDYPRGTESDDRERYSAVQLFLKVARRSRVTDPLSSEDLAVVARVCQLVAGLPLGIELAASLVGRVPLSAIVEGLERNLSSIAVTMHDLPERQQSLQAAFDYSWSALSPGEQNAFARISVFRGGFTVEAAEHVANASISELIALIDRSFLRQTVEGRYDCHPVLRHFGEIKLGEASAERDEIILRFCRYYMEMVHEKSAEMKSAQSDRNGRSALETETSNIWAALRLSMRTDDGTEYATALTDLNTVTWYAAVRDAGLNLEKQRQWFEARPERLNVLLIDVISVGVLVEHLADLDPEFGLDRCSHLPVLVENGIVDDRYVAVPYYSDCGLLYYRKDLLASYGYSAPPQTWDELEEMAFRVQQGERSKGRSRFWGYVWQGKDFEGLTCNALEWQASHGGGLIVSEDRTVQVNNSETIAALERAAGWINTISPPDVIHYDETKGRGIWLAGDALFYRGWSSDFGFDMEAVLDTQMAGQIQPILDRSVAGCGYLPDGGAGHCSTLGGGHIVISKYTKYPDESVSLVRHSNDEEAQRRRLTRNPMHSPTLLKLYDDRELLASFPHMQLIKALLSDGLVARPSTVAGKMYPHVSKFYSGAVHSVLTGRQDAATALASLEEELDSLLNRRTQS